METKKWFKVQHMHSSIPISFIKFPIRNLFLFTAICFALFMTSMASAEGVIQLPRTGQTVCYNTSGTIIACTGTGQDAEIKAGTAWPSPRFTFGAGAEAECMIDNLTGLMWPKNGNLPNGTKTWNDAIGYPETLTLCGHSDWRLPNINELGGLMDAQEANRATWLNSQGFTSAQSGWYWSSTSYYYTASAWLVHLGSGVFSHGTKTSSFYVWPVRGDNLSGATHIPKTGQTSKITEGDDGDLQKGMAWPALRFADNSDGRTVTDNLTGLIWTKAADISAPAACGPDVHRSWGNALAYVACLNTLGYSGHNDWRLPNINELKSLVDWSKFAPMLPDGSPFTNVLLKNYWSSTTDVTDKSSAWIVQMFDGGGVYSVSKPGAYCVWPVRGGQTGSSGTSVVLTVAKSGNGTVTANSGTLIWSGNTGTASYNSDASVTLTATAASGSTFAGWSGSGCSGTGTCVVAMSAAKTVTVTFNLNVVQQFALTVTKTGTGSGTVTSSPSGIDCGSTCSASYDAGTQVTLTAVADASSTFAGWGSPCSGTGACTVSMDSAKTVTAAFNGSGGVVIISSVPLTQGWNFISFPKQPTDTSIEKALADISANIRVVWGYDNVNKVWLKYSLKTQNSALNTLDKVESGKGYWIYMNATGTISMTGWGTPPATVNLYEDWNLAGYAGTDGVPPGTALSSIEGKWDVLWSWENGVWYAKQPSSSTNITTQPLNGLYQGKAYWIKIKKGQTGVFDHTGSGGSSGGGGGSTGQPLTGGIFTSGDFKVTVAEGTMPTAINAISPEAKPEITVPDTLPIKTNETNITAGAKAYTLNLAENGFMTTSSGAVTITVPFDPSLVPDPSKLNNLNVFLKIINPLDNSVVIALGTLSGNKITAELRGLPANMTIIVCYNPDMRAVAVSGDEKSPASVGPEATSYTWGSQIWVTVYDKAEVYSEVQKFLSTGGPLSEEQIENVVRTQVGTNAVKAALVYQTKGFRSPDLYAAGTNFPIFVPATFYMIHFSTKGTHYQPQDPDEVVGPNKNHYGRIYIEPKRLNQTKENYGLSIFNAIAHEMLHSIQEGHDLAAYYNTMSKDSSGNYIWEDRLNGIIEGTATCYGETLDQRLKDVAAKPAIRQITGRQGQTACETYKLSNWLFFYFSSCTAYSNQDFFTYVARKYGNNDFQYLKDLFERLKTDVGKKSPTPSWKAILEAIDGFFNSYSQMSLKDVYLDFVKQRAMEHNEESRFGRPNETTTGLAKELFPDYPNDVTKNGMVDVKMDPLSVTPLTIPFVEMPPLSTRALRIKPTAAIQTGGIGATLTFTVAATGGTVGGTLVGTVYYKNDPSKTKALEESQTLIGFGTSADDEIIILLSNVHLEDKNIDVTISITGTSGSGPVTQGASLDTLHKTQYVALWLTAVVNYSDNIKGDGFAALPYMYILDPTMAGSLSWNDRTFSQTMVLGPGNIITLNGVVSPDGNSIDITMTEKDFYDFPSLFKSELSTEIAITGLPFEGENAAVPVIYFTKTGPGAQSLTSVKYTRKTTYYDDNSVKTVTIQSIDWSNAELKAVFSKY